MEKPPSRVHTRVQYNMQHEKKLCVCSHHLPLLLPGPYAKTRLLRVPLHATLKGINDRESALFQDIDEKGVHKGARRYKVGDWVLVDRRNLTIPEGGKRALSDRWIGPFKVIEDRWDGYAYKVDIPARTRIHRVIHVSLLKPYKDARSIPPLVPT